MELFDRNIAEEWYQYGLKAGDDFFMRFMMHWLVCVERQILTKY